MARATMHQTTVRFGPDLWSALDQEAARLGVSAAQYVRDATLARLAYTEGLKHGRERLPAWMQDDRSLLEHRVVEELDSAAAVRTQGALARERAVRARGEAQRLRGGEGEIDRMSVDRAGAEPATHGSHLAAISRRVVGLMKQHYGKGPTGARTYHSGDLVVVLLSGGYTTVEKTLIAGGRSDAVSSQRSAFQETIRPLMRQIIEEELRRPVIAFMSTSHHDPDLNAELFLLAPDDGTREGAVPVPENATEHAT